MKNNIKKFTYLSNTNLLFVIVAFLFVQLSIGQNPGDEKNHKLWEHYFDTTTVNTHDLLNFHPPLETVNKHVIKNIVTNQYSFFMVFKSDTKEETKLVKIRNGRNKMYATNTRIISGQNKDYEQEVEKGMFVSFLTQFPKKRSFNNYLKIYKDVFNKEENNNKIYEILYYPKYLKPTALAKVQTYFSIKYGISLPNESAYVNSKNDTIWNPEKNIGFNNRVTGLAFDKKLNLNQLQSQNSRFTNLSISIDKKNIDLNNNSFYFLFGDNNENLQFQTEQATNLATLSRVWKVNISATDIDFNSQAKYNLNLKIEDNDFAEIDENSTIWMVIDQNSSNTIDYHNATYIKGSIVNNKYHFKNISFTNKQALFSFAKAPELLCLADISQPSCINNHTGAIDVTINGGIPPYKVSIDSDSYQKSELIYTKKHHFTDLTEGTYNLSIVDDIENSYNQTIVVEDSLSKLSLNSQWFIEDEDKGVAIELEGESNFLEKLQYNWYYNDKLVSTNREFKAYKSGIYHLSTATKKGCKQEFLFSVEMEDNSFLSDINIYPNPVFTNQNFTISFHLQEKNNINISIFSLDGKLIKTNNYKNLANQITTHSIATPGIYLILIQSNNEFTTKKIIIK